MDIKMIVCDLDRTLSQTDKSISDYTLEVLEKCRKRGILLGFAADRTENDTKPFINMVKPDILVLNGGALAKLVIIPFIR